MKNVASIIQNVFHEDAVMGDKKITPSMISEIARAYIAGFRLGLGRYNSAVGSFDFKAEAQKGAEKAAESAKAQGWEVSPEEIEQINQRIIHGFFKLLGKHITLVKK